ncbi:MAG: rRNA ((967)-C(5))-methyltransferase RsmB [Verrucomicrobiota bacterium]|jgi:16S rRNA (cytosine967-C5)-methyltransferase
MPANPRSLCLRALLDWEKGRSFSDEILHECLEENSLEGADRGLLTELFYGVLRQLSRLDHLLGVLREGPLDASTRSLLRMGLYQIFHTRIPAHAAVFETVSLAGRSRGLVNAVLRRAVREADSLRVSLLGESLAVRGSHPGFLVERWTEAFGGEAVERLCEWNNTPAETFFRVNTLRASREQLLAAQPEAEAYPGHEAILKLRRVPAEWLREGWGYVQDPSTLTACDLLDPQAGERVLDACAAPGGKTTYLAQKMGNRGRIVACEIFESRALRLRQNVSRLGMSVARVHTLDFLMPPEPESPLLEAPFDRILLDVPCSNTGVLRRRVDVRWRLTEEDFLRMPVQQFAMVRRAVPLLKPGGVLVYSTCSIESEENEAVVARVEAEFPELVLERVQRRLPFADAMDGAYAARFRKRE